MRSALASESVDFGEIKSNPRAERVTRITIHHMACNMEARDCALMHRDSVVQSSANYYIGTDGTICSGVDEDRRAWTSSSRDNDHRAITIEVANNSGEPSWTVSARAYTALIELCADICKRYGITPHFTGDTDGTLTIHKMFTNTACCGAYLEAKHRDGSIEADILSAMESEAPQKPSESLREPLYRVQCGAFRFRRNAETLKEELEADGYQTYLAVTDGGIIRVQCGAFRIAENAQNLLQKIQADGYEAFITTAQNQTALDRDGRTGKRSTREIAEEIVRGEGDWGTDPQRREKLLEAGYDADEVQDIINELMRQ